MSGTTLRRVSPDERRRRLEDETARVRQARARRAAAASRPSGRATGGTTTRAGTKSATKTTKPATKTRSTAKASAKPTAKSAPKSAKKTSATSATKGSRSRTAAYAHRPPTATIRVSTRPPAATARHRSTRSSGPVRPAAVTAPAVGARGAKVGAAATSAGAGVVGLIRSLFDVLVRHTSPPKGPRLLTTPLKTSPVHTRRRLVALIVLVCVLFGTVVVRLTNLQVLNPQQYLQFGVSQRVREEVLSADRGTIFDRNGVELAISLPQKSVFVDPKLVTDPAGEAQKLAPVLGLQAADVEALMRKPNRFNYVARFLDEDVAKKVEALSLAGVAFVEEPKRYNPSGDVASAIVGGVDPEGKGTSGLEKRYTDELTGRPGKLVLEQTPEGRTIPVGDHQLLPAKKGDDLVLTVDRSMQFEVQRLLTEQVTAAGAKGGTAVVTKPDTGEVLAMVNVAKNDKGEVEPDGSNGALTASYEPGSVMKLVTVAGAIEDKKVNPDTVLNLPVALPLGGFDFTDAEDRGPVAWPVHTIIEQSSNVGTILIGQRLGRERVVDYMKQFGFNQKTGIDFPSEQAGVVPPANKWSDSSAGTVPIGQGVTVTPTQMLAAYNVIANGGVYVSPKLVQATIDANGMKHPTPDPQQRQVVSAETANQLNVILRSVVAQGTGTKAAVQGYTVAGKTGTARKSINGSYKAANGEVKYQSTFVGFAPAEAPKVSVLVMIDEPAGDQIFGGLVAAPLFSKITEFALRQLGVPPPVTDGPAGGGPANSDAQAKMAAVGNQNPQIPEDTNAVQILPDGRVRGVAAGLPPGSFIPFPAAPGTPGATTPPASVPVATAPVTAAAPRSTTTVRSVTAPKATTPTTAPARGPTTVPKKT